MSPGNQDKSTPDENDSGYATATIFVGRHLMVERQLAWQTCNLVASGLRLFYNVTLSRTMTLIIPPRKTPRPLPEILSVQELERFFLAPSNLKRRTLLMTTYAAGLRGQ